VVEGDGGDVVVEDVGLDDTMHQGATDETEFAVDSCGGTASKVPCVSIVVREGWVGVLEEGDGN